MIKEPKYYWVEETGEALCEIEYKDRVFIGGASCHPDDRDMMSRLTGTTIAEWRALIKCYTFIRDAEIKPQLKILKQLYHSMDKSKHFNPKSYESIMLFRQIHLLEKDLAGIKQELANAKQNLIEYIQQKEKDHIKIREFQNKKALDDTNQ